jgi:hypothetical protein
MKAAAAASGVINVRKQPKAMASSAAWRNEISYQLMALSLKMYNSKYSAAA